MASQSSPLTPIITASTNNIPRDSLDCGLQALGWCKGEKCQRLARLRFLLPIFLLIGILQGASETYFRISTKQTTSYQNYDSQIIDWLLVSSYIFQALLAFFIGFWSQHYHPIKWLGGATIFQSVFYFLSVIPTLTHYDFDITSTKYDNFTSLCKTSYSSLELDEDYSIMKLVMLFLLQFGIALGYTAFYTIGLPYIDDNAYIDDAPSIFGSALAVHVWGFLFGSLVTFIADVNYLSWWFGWIIFGPLLLISGILIALFPRKLLRTVLNQAAQRIIDGSSINLSRTRPVQYLDDVNFLPSIRRLLTNKILLLNLFGLTFVKTGIYNYNLNEQIYLQSRFYFPADENNGIMDEWLSRFLSYLLKPPIVGTCIFITGLTISKLKPSARCLSLWNIISGCLIMIIFISYLFIDCSDSDALSGVRKGVVKQPYCSRECICSTNDLLFLPVCPEKSNLTYFSPCHAGCKDKVSLNDITIYEHCTCSSDPEHPVYPSEVRATQGACNMKECQIKWITFQVLAVVFTTIFGIMLVCKIMITMRSVLDQDKSLALSLELFLSGIFVYVLGKIIYDIFTRNTCAFWSLNYKKCLLQDSPLHGNILNFITIFFVGIGIIMDILVYIFTGDLDLFIKNPPYEDHFHFTPPLITVPQRNIPENNNDNERPIDTTENIPILQSIENPQEQQQQQEQLNLPRQRLPRANSPSSSSESQISPNISPYRRQGAIPKTKIQRQQNLQTSETDF